MKIFFKPFQKGLFWLYFEDFQFFSNFLQLIIEVLQLYCVQIAIEILLHGRKFFENLSWKEHSYKGNPLIIFIFCPINIQTRNLPTINYTCRLSNNLFIPPRILSFLLNLAKPAHKLIVSDNKWILHISSCELCLIIINTT